MTYPDPTSRPDPSRCDTSRAEWSARAEVILDSYRHRLGRDLFERSGDAVEDARRLDDLPLAVLAHDSSAQPRLDWVNRAAGQAFDATPARLLGMPSAETAPADAAADRGRMFETLAETGFVSGYSGIRISVSGRRFMIEDVTVLTLTDAAGRPAGHAAIIGKTRQEG